MFIDWSPTWLTQPMQHVVDLTRLEPVALEHRTQHPGGEIDGVHAAERSAGLAAPGGGADDVDDDGGGLMFSSLWDSRQPPADQTSADSSGRVVIDAVAASGT